MELVKGSYIRAKLIEEVEANQWIVSFQGNLLRVVNTTDITFSKNLLLNLQVIQADPLSLKILSSGNQSRSLKINVSV